MKDIFIYFLLISINITGMGIEKLVSKTDAECLLLYKAHIARTLPYELCKQIDSIYRQLTNNKRKENFIKTEKGRWQTSYNQRKHHSLTINNNGHYYVYNCLMSTTLINTDKKKYDKPIDTGSRTPIHFSSNNAYCIIKGNVHTYLYNLINQTEHTLQKKEDHLCLGITISNNSQHILLEGRHTIEQSKPIYFLWSVDEQEEPKAIPLKNDLFHSMATIFHPDNEHIIHNQYHDELHLYNIAAAQDVIISRTRDKNVLFIDTFKLTSDNKTILAKTIHKEIDTQPDHILFNIEDLNNVTSITLAPQSCHNTALLPVLVIPHKQMLTHVTNAGCTLELIDHNQNLIATHQAPQNSYITAITVDTTGNYLAIGHSNGTIVIWNICSSKPKYYEKIYITSNGSITSLTLTENELLLSQSKTKKCGNALLWDLCGNEIINFGDNIFNSIISPNGKTITIACSTPEDSPVSNYCSMLMTYHQTDEMLALCNNKELSLAQLSKLIAEKNINFIVT